MLDYHKRFVATADMVVRFHRPDGVRRLQFLFEDALKGIFPAPGKSLDQGFPSALTLNQGPAPRWMLSEGRRNLIATDEAISLNLNFQGNPPSKGLKETLSRYANEVDRACKEILGPENLIFAGIVVAINFSYRGIEAEVSHDIAERFIKFPIPQRVTASAITLGFAELGGFAGLNFLYQFNPFKNVEVKITAEQARSGQPINFEDGPSTDRGLQIRVDVNDRILETSHPEIGHGLLGRLIDPVMYACSHGVSELLGEETLKVEGL